MAAGYSGTPLPKKLGIKDSTRLLAIGEPENYDDLLGPLPTSVDRVGKEGASAADLVHVFVTCREDLDAHLKQLRATLNPKAAVWISWPKKASKVPTPVTEDTIRELALPLGFVDIKVCAVSAVWSALKLVVRKELRPKSAA